MLLLLGGVLVVLIVLLLLLGGVLVVLVIVLPMIRVLVVGPVKLRNLIAGTIELRHPWFGFWQFWLRWSRLEAPLFLFDLRRRSCFALTLLPLRYREGELGQIVVLRA